MFAPLLPTVLQFPYHWHSLPRLVLLFPLNRGRFFYKVPPFGSFQLVPLGIVISRRGRAYPSFSLPVRVWVPGGRPPSIPG